MLSDDLQKLLIAAFAEEAARLLLDYREQLRALTEAEDGPSRLAAIVALRRTAHTLKGAARSTEFPEIESLAMTLEERYREFERTSATPYLSPESLSVLSEAGVTLDALVKAALSDAGESSGKGLFGLIERLERIQLTEPQEREDKVGSGLPDTVRERLKFLTKTLLKLLSDTPSPLKIKKSQQIVSSLLGLLQEHRIESVLDLVQKMDSVFRLFGQRADMPTSWPVNQALLDVLAGFRKDWSAVDSESTTLAMEGLDSWKPLDSTALEEVQEEQDSNDEELVLRLAFRDEALASLSGLRELIEEGRKTGHLETAKLQIGVMALMGATRAVDLPLAETICTVLESSLLEVASQQRVPGAVLDRALTVLTYLESDVGAYVERSSPPESWRAMLAIEKLEASVQDLVDIKLVKSELASKVQTFRSWVGSEEDSSLLDGLTHCRELEQLFRSADMVLRANWLERVAANLEARKSECRELSATEKASLLKLVEFVGNSDSGTLSELENRFEELWKAYLSSPAALAEESTSLRQTGEPSEQPAPVVELAAPEFWCGPSTERLSVLASSVSRNQELLSALSPTLEVVERWLESEGTSGDIKAELETLAEQLAGWHRSQTELNHGILSQLADCQEELRQHQTANSQTLAELLAFEWQEMGFANETLTLRVSEFTWDRQLWMLGGLREILRSLWGCLRQVEVLPLGSVELELTASEQSFVVNLSTRVGESWPPQYSFDQELLRAAELSRMLGGGIRVTLDESVLQLQLEVLRDLPLNRAVFFRWNNWVLALPTLEVCGVQRAVEPDEGALSLEFRGESWAVWPERSQEVKTALFLKIAGEKKALLVGELIGELSFTARALSGLICHPSLLPMSTGLLGESRPVLFLDPNGPFDLRSF